MSITKEQLVFRTATMVDKNVLLPEHWTSMRGNLEAEPPADS